MSRHHKRGKHWLRGLHTDDDSIRPRFVRKGKAKTKVFRPLDKRTYPDTPSVHVVHYTRNGVYQGKFEVTRPVSSNGVLVLFPVVWNDDLGKWERDYLAPEDDQAVIETAQLGTKAILTYLGFVCPKCGSSSYLHNCPNDE